ncbi:MULTISPECIES: RagB/SusD family nutrient uptake outer membrane protein [Butyricimonas]|uniref:RagB/SusD family nutrient uptake outer membrane protein n=1 Tax=Butyricimonas TaxID=574697 RepID=UPI0007FB1ED6|nr:MULTISPECIES: RagB/SusD family nutrient uptake outer membrane protein [Butyricimonas]
MKTVKYIMGLLVAFSMTGCNDWFDVSPETQISSDDLYSTGDGFRMQVNGIYKSLSAQNLYGKELTWGLVDVLGQYYIKENLDQVYQDVNDRLYETSDVLSLTDGIWSGMYKVIADCNNIIEHVEKASNSIFENGEGEKCKIHGEALAMRAFIHFDLLRLFAPSPAQNENGTWIPYVKDSESVINNKMTVKQVLENVEQDLLEAHSLMVQWDSVVSYSKSWREEVIWMWVVMGGYWKSWSDESEYAEFFGHQRSRMNMVSVNALLARVYAYMGEKKKAYDVIEEMLKMGGRGEEWRFDQMDYLPAGECRLLGDVIFNLYNKQVGEYYAPYLTSEHPLYLRNITQVFPSRNQIDGRFEKLLMQIGSDYVSVKNRRTNLDVAYLPVIRKSELYYIKGEYLASVGKVDEAVELLRKVRSARGDISTDDLNTITTEAGYIQAMLADARKEFIAEGQSFYMFKRLNLPIFDGKQNIDFRNNNYLPVPKSEESAF